MTSPVPDTGSLAGKEAPASGHVVVVGLSHRTAPLDLIERMTVSDANLPRALCDLKRREAISEAVVLSTCVRTEVYAVAGRPDRAMSELRDFFGEWSGRAPEQLDDSLYAFHGQRAISHLFQVASGLDSTLLGEGEIIRQVRQAWRQAEQQDAAGPALTRLFRHSVEVGKRARSETRISRGTTSLSRAAVSLAAEHLGSLAGRTILVVGAGEMGEGIAQALAAVPGIGEILVANRTRNMAVTLAKRVGGQPLGPGDLAVALERADLLLTSTGSPHLGVEAADLRAGLTARDGRPLLVMDVAGPRDVDPVVGDLPGITLLNVDDLKAAVEFGMSERCKEIGAVNGIVEDEIGRFLELSAQRQAGPLVAALRDRAEQFRKAELDRYQVRLSGLDERERATVDALTRGVLAKLLHEPSVRLKKVTGSDDGSELAEAVRVLFDL
ncbi:MAG: glutamyl-tRNA reductase [Nocardioides sp.]|nr:glutamyl-tRNA reductase [Nocardioides sp.]